MLFRGAWIVHNCWISDRFVPTWNKKSNLCKPNNTLHWLNEKRVKAGNTPGSKILFEFRDGKLSKGCILPNLYWILQRLTPGRYNDESRKPQAIAKLSIQLIYFTFKGAISKEDVHSKYIDCLIVRHKPDDKTSVQNLRGIKFGWHTIIFKANYRCVTWPIIHRGETNGGESSFSTDNFLLFLLIQVLGSIVSPFREDM